MIETIFNVITSIEVIVLTSVLILILFLTDPARKFSRKRKDCPEKITKKSKQKPNPEEEPPGKILVTDSTYEILTKEKEKKK